MQNTKSSSVPESILEKFAKRSSKYFTVSAADITDDPDDISIVYEGSSTKLASYNTEPESASTITKPNHIAPFCDSGVSSVTMPKRTTTKRRRILNLSTINHVDISPDEADQLTLQRMLLSVFANFKKTQLHNCSCRCDCKKKLNQTKPITSTTKRKLVDTEQENDVDIETTSFVKQPLLNPITVTGSSTSNNAVSTLTSILATTSAGPCHGSDTALHYLIPSSTQVTSTILAPHGLSTLNAQQTGSTSSSFPFVNPVVPQGIIDLNSSQISSVIPHPVSFTGLAMSQNTSNSSYGFPSQVMVQNLTQSSRKQPVQSNGMMGIPNIRPGAMQSVQRVETPAYHLPSVQLNATAALRYPGFIGDVSVPPAPILMARVDLIGVRVFLEWAFDSRQRSRISTEITSYQIACCQSERPNIAWSAWNLMEPMAASPLPMTATLASCNRGNGYCFRVRAIDRFNRPGPFSEIQLCKFN